MNNVTVQLSDREIEALKARTGKRSAAAALKAWAARANAKRSIAELRAALKASLQEEATGNPLKKGAAIASGARLRVPGIRYVRAIKSDTLRSVANQNHVLPERLALANHLAPDTPGDHEFSAGDRILIPIHEEKP